MRVLRSWFLVCVCAISAWGATFGTVVSNPQGQSGISDIVLDERLNRLYLVNSSQSRIDVYSTASNPPRLTNTVRVGATPLSAALSRNFGGVRGKYLYVACYDASSLNVIDVDRLAVTSQITLAAKPEGIAVGFDDKVLISTIGTGQGQAGLIYYDPTADASRSLTALAVAPSLPSPPTLPPPSNRIFLSGRGRLEASPDGRVIIGVNEPANNTRTVFVYDAVSNIVTRSRNVTNLSPIVSISPDGSKFMAGLILFETSSLTVLAQQNAANAPFSFPGGGANNFNTQTNQGGSVFSPDGARLYSAFNIAPTQSPAAKPNVSRFLFNDPDNLLITLGLQLPENLAGKMVITSNGNTIYALSESGFMVLPLSTLNQFPIAQPDSPVVLLANDQCGVTADQQLATIPIKNVGGGARMTATAQLLQTTNTGPVGLGGATGPGGGGLGGLISILLPPVFTGGGAGAGIGTTNNGLTVNTANNTTASAPQVRVTQNGNNQSDLAVRFSPVAARALGTVPPHDLLIQSDQAINIPPNVRVYQNNRDAEAKGTVIAVPIGTSSTEGLVDMVIDNARLRLYIANSGLNRVEVFDIRSNRFLNPIKVGQLPRSLALGTDGSTLYVGNNGGETISIVDLDRNVVTGRVKFPPIPFNAAFSIITPSVIASTQRGPQILMSDGTLWKVVGDTAQPRILNPSVFGTARTIAGPIRTMASSPEGRYTLLLAGNGNAYVYSADVDDYINARTIVSNPITGYYGPVAAGPNGSYYIVNNLVLNEALTQINSSPTFTIGGATDPTQGGGLGPTPGIGGNVLPGRGGPTTASRPVASVAAVGANTFARFSTPIRLNANATTTDAGQLELVDVASGRTTGIATALEGPLATGTSTQRINTNGRTLAVDPTGTNAYVLTTSGLSIIPIDRAVATDRPTLQNNPIVNTASMQPGASTNGLISILGRNLAAADKSNGYPLPTILGGTCVTLNNVPLNLLASDAGQINAQLPPTLAAGRYPVVVRSITKKAGSNSVTATVAKYAPAVFVDATGPVVYHKDGKRVTRDNPANRDEPLVMYAAGLGPTKGGKVTAGTPSPNSPLAVTDKVQVFFGNPNIKEAEVIVDWSGLQPGTVGVYQLNLRVPGAHVKGEALPITVRIGGVNSPTTGANLPVIAVN